MWFYFSETNVPKGKEVRERERDIEGFVGPNWCISFDVCVCVDCVTVCVFLVFQKGEM